MAADTGVMKTIVFLPGTLCDARVFAPQIAHFAATGWRVRIPLINHHEGGLPGLAADILSRLPGHFAVVGLSLGGIVAIEMIRQSSDRVTHAALLDTRDTDDNQSARDQREADYATATAMGLENFMRDEMAKRYLHPQNQGRKDICQTLIDMALDAGIVTWRAQLDLLSTRRNRRNELSQFSAPTLVACGEADEICPPALHRAIASAIPHAHLQLFPDCGHLPTLESPHAVTHALSLLVDENTD